MRTAVPRGPAVTVAGIPVVRGLAGGLLPLAHHPHCDRHRHHLLWVAGRPLCLGCTMMALGAVAGIALAALVPWGQLRFVDWVVLHLALVGPNVFQPLVRRKPYKIGARFLPGMGSASYLFSGLVLRTYLVGPWPWRGLVATAFALGFVLLFTWRRRKLDDPCASCPQGYFPTCEWNLPRLLSENAHHAGWARPGFTARAAASRPASSGEIA